MILLKSYCLLFILMLYISLLLVLRIHLYISYILYLFIIALINLINLFLYFFPNYSIYSLISTSHLYLKLNLLSTILFFFPPFYNLLYNKLTMSHIRIIFQILLLFVYILTYLLYIIHFVPLTLNSKIFRLVYNFFFYLVKILLTNLLPQIPRSPQSNPCLNMANIICLIRSFFIIYNIFFLNNIHMHMFLLYPFVPYNNVNPSPHLTHPK